MVSVTIQQRAHRSAPFTVNLSGSSFESATVSQLKSAIESKLKLSVHRQKLTTADKKSLADDEQSLASLGVAEGDTITLKDLGPQISWRTVFLVEYFGPLFIHPALYFKGAELFYNHLPFGKASSGSFEHSTMQKIAFGMVMIHFLKREVETLYVHRFSHATMPWTNIIKNSAHYWGLSGLLLALPLYGPWNSASALSNTLRSSTGWLAAFTALWTFSEVSNAIVHLNLSSMRPAGSKTRVIPRGYGFSLVSFPNYMFESLAWIAFTLLTLDPAAALFAAVGTAQMMAWAKKKHRNYKKEFGDKYPSCRKAMFPFIF